MLGLVCLDIFSLVLVLAIAIEITIRSACQAGLA